MPLDFDALVLSNIYALQGSPATYRPSDGGPSVALTACEDSAGQDSALGGSLAVQSMQPAALVRRAELAARALNPDDMVGGTLALNGTTWSIRTWQPKPGPNGAPTGEVRLVLQAGG